MLIETIHKFYYRIEQGFRIYLNHNSKSYGKRLKCLVFIVIRIRVVLHLMTYLQYICSSFQCLHNRISFFLIFFTFIYPNLGEILVQIISNYLIEFTKSFGKPSVILCPILSL